MNEDKPKRGIWKYIIIGIVVIGVIGAFASMGGDDNDNNTTTKATTKAAAETTTTEPEEQYTQITSTELIDLWDENSVKCKQLYDNQMLEVTGTIESVGEDILGDIYVTLGHDTETFVFGIQCYAADEDTENQIAELTEGDVITVRGVGSAGSMSFAIKKATIK